MVSAEKAVTLSGTSCSLSAVRCAVTVTSSSRPAASSWASAAGSASEAEPSASNARTVRATRVSRPRAASVRVVADSGVSRFMSSFSADCTTGSPEGDPQARPTPDDGV